MLESVLTAKVKKMIREEFPGAWVYKASDRFQAGIPDLLICYQGRFIALELKSEKGRATPLQVYVLRMIREAGGCAEVCRTVEEARNLLTTHV